MKIHTQLLYYILNIMIKHDGDQIVFVYSGRHGNLSIENATEILIRKIAEL